MKSEVIPPPPGRSGPANAFTSLQTRYPQSAKPATRAAGERRKGFRGAGLLAFLICLLPFAGAHAQGVRGLSCTQTSGAGWIEVPCTVSLGAPAGSRGVNVYLKSNSGGLLLPASSVKVPAGAISAPFTAIIYSYGPTASKAVLTASGGGSSATLTFNLLPGTRILGVSTTSLSFGSVTLNQPAVKTVILSSVGNLPVTVNSISISGTGFSFSGPATPLDINPGQTVAVQVRFDPTTAGAATGVLSVSSGTNVYEAFQGGPALVSLSGSGTSPVNATLSGLSCAAASLTGAATDACTVSLSAAAPSTGLAVTVASSNSAVQVPASVTVPSGATSAAFTANVSAVTTAVTDTLTAVGGGVSRSFALQLNAATPALTLSATSLAFGNTTLNTVVTKAVTLKSSGTAALTINGANVSGAGFSVSGANFPMTLSPGQSATLSVQFDPTAAGSVTGALTVSSNASSGGTATVGLSGTGMAPAALSAVACSNLSLTGAGTDACTVTLTAAAPSGGLAVTLASSNGAVTVPASLTVGAGATSAAFTATVSAVSTTATATLTATAAGVAKTVALQLSPSTVALTVGSTSIAFGTVTLNSPSTQSLTVKSTGTSALTISAGSVTGTGFSLAGATFPMTLNPGQSATLSVQFDPTVAGAVSGKLALTSNATAGSTTTIALSGTGQSTAYSVSLTWSAPTASATDPVTGYNIYRQDSGGSSYTQVDAALSSTTYSDSSVQSGKTYNYYVVSIDAAGAESGPSNVYTVSIP